MVPIGLAAAVLVASIGTSSAVAAAPAEPGGPGLAHCAAIAAATDRLACYDGLAGRAPAPSEPLPTLGPAAVGSRIEPKNAPPSESAVGTASGTSLLSRYWELEPEEKRGTFEVVNYQPNYVLPLRLTNRINRAPASPTEAVSPQPSYRRAEAEFQFSIRTKVAQDLPHLGGDLWLAFTQRSFWQVYDAADSRPFRNTDYQPEAIYVRPIPASLGEMLPYGWRWRYAQLALAHQSNGQSDPLSRSWNRAYLGLGADRGDWALNLRWNERLFSRPDTDNNPDLVRRRGQGEAQLLWAHGLHTALVEVRTSLHNTHDGAVRLEYTYPIFRDQPNGLRWIVRAFSGYAETLTDYNFRQTSIGAGVSFLQF